MFLSALENGMQPRRSVSSKLATRVQPGAEADALCERLWAVMEGRTLSIATYHTKLDDDFEIATKDPAERKKLAEGMRAVEARIEADMDPYQAAARMEGHDRATLYRVLNGDTADPRISTVVEACRALAERRGVPVKRVIAAAQRAAAALQDPVGRSPAAG